jgi:hypothetical protein
MSSHSSECGFPARGNCHRISLLARLYLVEAITTSQDGNRFRLDLNWRL